MSAFVTAGAGFLLAVLPEEALASIASYYARVTTAARPMNRLIALDMLAMLAAIVIQISRGAPRQWVAWISLALAAGSIALAGLRIVPRAVRLGKRVDPPRRQSTMAREILREHLLCAAMIATLLVLQLSFA